MQIKVEQLAKKPFEVKGSVKNLKKTYKFQKDMAQMEDITETAEGTEMFGAMDSMLDELIDYLSTILHLTAKQVELLEELEQPELIFMAQRVAMRLMGASEEDIASINEDAEEGLEVIPEKD